MPELRVKCIHCESSMEPGYIADRGHGNVTTVAKWIGDAPDTHWYGLKTRGHDKFPLSAYRCRKCGYVELRAVEPGKA